MTNRRALPEGRVGGISVLSLGSSRVRKRRRTNSGMWLDYLPEDVRNRVASMVCAGKPSKSALHLAETSATQAEAVASALSYTLEDWSRTYWSGLNEEEGVIDLTEESSIKNYERTIKAMKEQTRLRWVAVMRPFVREISQEFGELVDAPNLRKIRLHPCRYDFIKKAMDKAWRNEAVHPVPEADIYLDFAIERISPELLFALLRCLDLRKLNLYGQVQNKHLCSVDLNRPRLRSSKGVTLAECCPALETLRLGTIKFDRKIIVQVLPSFARLKEVDLHFFGWGHEKLPKSFIAWMRGLECVMVESLNEVDPMNFARKIGASLGSISLRVATPTDVYKLRKSNLRKLRIARCEGKVEVALADSVHYFAQLRCLRLEWPSESCLGFEVRSCLHYTEHFYATEPGAITEIVKNLPLLSSLELLKARIPFSELSDALQRMGSRLVKFRCSVAGQDEPALDRYERILDVLGKNNPCIELFDITERPPPFGNNTRTKEEIDQGFRIMRLAQVLKENAPSLVTFGIKYFIGNLVPNN